MIDFKVNWQDHLLFIELSYNNYHDFSISMVSFEEIYGSRCRSPVGWFEVGDFSLIYPEMIYETLEKVQLINDRSKMAYSHQKLYVENRRLDLELEVGDKVYLKISPIKGVMRLGRRGNLVPSM